MYRATTPTHTFTLPEQAASYAEIHITYRQGTDEEVTAEVVKHAQDGTIPPGMSFDDKKVIISLTQEETKQFKADDFASVQVRVLTSGGYAYASRIFKIKINDVLNDEVLS